MRSVSSEWTEAIAASQGHALEVSVVDTGELLPVTAGQVVLDITAATRGRCDLTFNDPALIPVDADSVLAPFSTELQVKRGLIYPSGERELVSLGIFRIEETTPDDTGEELSVKVSGLDRSAWVIDALFEDPYTIAGGTDYITAIKNTIEAGYPGATYDFPARTLQTPTLKAEEGEDRWAFCQAMAAAIGMDLYFDNEGVLMMRPISLTTSDPVAELVEGRAGVTVKPTLLSASKKWTRTDAHNRWIVKGDNPDVAGTPPRAIATDDAAESPTRYGGPFGRKPEIYSSSFISTNQQAQDAANGKKEKEIGISQSVDFGAVVNPALEPGDVCRITRTRKDPLDPENPIPLVDENHILDTLTIPLGASEHMTGGTRASRITG